MTKNELIDNIALKTDIDKSSCEVVIDTLIDEIKFCLINGEKVVLKNFMSFEVTEKPERKGRNPKTGMVTVFPTVKSIKCKASKVFKNTINTR